MKMIDTKTNLETDLAVNEDNTRRSFLHRGTVIASAGGALFALAAATPTRANDYKDKGQGNGDNDCDGDRSDVKANFVAIQKHENDHVAFLVNALGSMARPKPTFQNLHQPSKQMFKQTSQALENTGCGAYLGAAPALFSHTYLAAAGSIALIEARHAGWLDSLLGDPITQNVSGQAPSFEMPLTAAQVVTLASPFVASLNGGPPLTYSTTPSASNDIAILNFALALEYLESEFYNLNVPQLF